MEFKKGDIVTYDSCPTTIAVFDYKKDSPNDSGDPVYKCVVAITKDSGLYLGNLVLTDDMRLANQEEIANFYDKLNMYIWELKQEIFNLKYKTSEINRGREC